MIKLGAIKPTVFSDDGRYCLRYNLYGLGLATLINMKNNDKTKIHLPKTIAACAISKHGDKVLNIDGRGIIYVTDTQSLETEKIADVFLELNLSKDCMPRKMFFLDDLNKIVTFVYFEQYKPREEFLCVIITDLQTKKSEIALKIENSCFLSVEKIDNELILFLILRKTKTKHEYGFIKFEIPIKTKDIYFESSEQYGINSWYLKNLSPFIFDFSNRYFYGIRLPEIFKVDYSNCCFLDYDNKSVISNEGAFWKDKAFEVINWLPKENLFLFKLKHLDKYYIGNIESKAIIAEITFNGYEINITKCFLDKKPILLTLANKKDFNFTNKSTPINRIYVPNNKFLVFVNGRDEFALEMDVFMRFLD